MVKNALEAMGEDGPVALTAVGHESNVIFSVNNPGTIPRRVQPSVFKRSFSTKGDDRGLGTYSMRLLGEHYLGGEVWFSSSKKLGTTFFISLPTSGPTAEA